MTRRNLSAEPARCLLLLVLATVSCSDRSLGGMGPDGGVDGAGTGGGGGSGGSGSGGAGGSSLKDGGGTSDASASDGGGLACADNGSGNPCPSGFFCDPRPGLCKATNNVTPGVCVTNVMERCQGVLEPVCGCDGKTYANECERRNARAQLDHTGACKSTVGAGQFACGDRACARATELCQETTGGPAGTPPRYECLSLPQTCQRDHTCACLGQAAVSYSGCTVSVEGDITIIQAAP